MKTRRQLRQRVETDGPLGQTSPAYATINDLPDELVEKIVEDLDDNESICRLSLTCKRLHFLVLPTFFSRNKLENPQNGSFYCHDPVPELLEAIRTALFIRHLSTITIHYTSTVMIEEVVSDISSLCGLLARIPPVETILLGLPRSIQYPHGILHTERWGRAFLKLLETIAKNGCRDLRLLDPLDLSPDGYNNLNVPIPPPMKPEGTKPRGTRNSRGLRSHPHTIGMSTLRILSRRLFQPFFIGWIIDMLEIHQKSLVCVHLNVTSIHPVLLVSRIFESMNLPAVKEVNISSSRFDIRVDLCSFLNRHSLITSLHLDGIHPYKDQILAPIVLPYLTQLTAMSPLVILLLQHRNRVPLLSSVNVLLNWNDHSEPNPLAAIATHAHISSLQVSNGPRGNIRSMLERHIREDARIITSLGHIRSVVLNKPVRPVRSSSFAVKRWLELFPHLEHVSLSYCLLDVREGLSDEERYDVVIELATQFAADRPTMKTISVESVPVVDLDDLRRMPGFKA